jgi:hypothetical protein
MQTRPNFNGRSCNTFNDVSGHGLIFLRNSEQQQLLVGRSCNTFNDVTGQLDTLSTRLRAALNKLKNKPNQSNYWQHERTESCGAAIVKKGEVSAL